MPKKQKDGRYRAKVTIGHTMDGNPIHKWASGATQRELEENKATLRAHYIDGGQSRADVLFGEYAQLWYVAKKKPKEESGTQDAYLTYLNKHIMPVFGDRMMRSFRAMEIQQWLNGYENMSKTFLTMLRSILRNIFKSAYAEGILQYDPAVSLSMPAEKPPEERRAFTDDETDAILATIERHEHGSFLAVLYYLGLRRGEALGLMWGDFDWDGRSVKIDRDVDYSTTAAGKIGPLKTKASYRTVPVPDELYRLLYPMQEDKDGLLFPARGNKPISRTTYQRRYMAMMIDAGLAKEVVRKKAEKKKHDIRFDWTCEITAHYFRHNYATMLYYAGVDPLSAMRILGHSSYAVTAKIYTHLDSMHVDTANARINKQISKNKSCRKVAESKKSHSQASTPKKQKTAETQ